MKCIFCKRDSSDAKSIEHIIPESLGNTTLKLPLGAVCDRCNNYFATHLEGPVLDSAEFRYLRFNQQVHNKKGKTPAVNILVGNQVVRARRENALEFIFSKEDFIKISADLASQTRSKIKIPISGPSAKDHLVSRWLAKMGLELLAHRVQGTEGWNNEIVNNKDLDSVRNFSRAPKPNEMWTFSKRRIYDENHTRKNIEERYEQIIFECDILATGPIEASEFYFVAAFFGIEYAINLGGNSMEGYNKWLSVNNNISPLYANKKSYYSA